MPATCSAKTQQIQKTPESLFRFTVFNNTVLFQSVQGYAVLPVSDVAGMFVVAGNYSRQKRRNFSTSTIHSQHNFTHTLTLGLTQQPLSLKQGAPRTCGSLSYTRLQLYLSRAQTRYLKADL